MKVEEMTDQECKELERLIKVKKQVEELFQTYLEGMILITQIEKPDLKELTYLKARIDTDDGGLYFWSLMHVDGKKIQLKELEDRE